MKKSIFSLCCAVFLSITIFACSNSSYYGLLNKGVLPLSTDNAFLGTNIFLAHEAEKDDTLLGFFRSHGAPNAIEIKSENFDSDKLILYYVKEGSSYIGTAVADEYNARHWIFRGPYRILWQEAKRMKLLARTNDVPVLHIHGRDQRFYRQKKVPAKQVPEVVRPTPKPTPRPVYRPRPRKAAPKTKTAQVIKTTPTPIPQPTTYVPSLPQTAPTGTELDPRNFYKLNSDQRALLMAQGYAAQADNGDIIHIVKRDGETIDMISRWYTGYSSNVDAIAKYNGLTPDAALTRGNQIRVPKNLVSIFKLMSPEFK